MVSGCCAGGKSDIGWRVDYYHKNINLVRETENAKSNYWLNAVILENKEKTPSARNFLKSVNSKFVEFEEFAYLQVYQGLLTN